MLWEGDEALLKGKDCMKQQQQVEIWLGQTGRE